MTNREGQIAAFLQANGWNASHARPFAGDASFRRYFRLVNGSRSVVLMDAPSPQENVAIFAALARHLRRLGFSAPAIFAENERHGFLLIEDLGDDTFTRELAAGATEADLYALAADVLAALHRLPIEMAAPPGLPPYDETRLLDEALLLPDWYMPAVFDSSASMAARNAYIEAFRSVLPIVDAQPGSLVLRDFHVDNLIRLKDRDGIAACGLLDFQDAVVGPPAYDVMSLVEDARRDVSMATRRATLERYCKAVGVSDRAAFDAAFAVLAGQRHAKVIGIFTRLSRRDGKHHYLVHIPRVWALLETALKHPALAPVSRWFEDHLPAEKRIIPSCGRPVPQQE